MARSSGFVPEFVFVVVRGTVSDGSAKYFTNCRHVYCPTWDLLSSKCVRYWTKRDLAEKLAAKYHGRVELIEYRRIGSFPQGR